MIGALCTSMLACKSKMSDADIQAHVETVISSNPTVTATVKDAVVTLNGTVSSEAEKTSLENTVKTTEGKAVKSVVNNIVVQELSINTNLEDLHTKVVDAVKDFPTIHATVNDGVITVTGEVDEERLMVLKQSLDALSPKRVDMSALIIK